MAGDCHDETDRPPSNNRVTHKDWSILLYSIVVHFIDVFCDYYSAVVYFQSSKYAFFASTLAFTLLPSVITAVFSIIMYVQDSEDPISTKRSKIRIILCVLGIFLQGAPVIRNCDSLYFAIKSIKAESRSKNEERKEYFHKMLKEDSDAALLRVLECYLESAPQLVLQITLLLVDYINGSFIHNNMQFVLIGVGVVSMGLCMMNYNRVIRFDQENKKNMSTSGAAIQFFWHMNLTISRVLALSAMTVLYTFWTGLAIGIHWLGMMIWIIFIRKSDNRKFQCIDFLFSCTYGLVYIFNFVNLKEGSTKIYYMIFYSVCFVENVIAATIWGVKSVNIMKTWSYYIFLIFPIVCFILSVLLSIVYYKWFHPNKLKLSSKSDEETFLSENLQSNGQRTTD